MFVSLAVCPCDQGLSVPTVIHNVFITEPIRSTVGGNFPLVIPGIRIWVWMSPVEGICLSIVPSEVRDTAATIVVAPEECRVVTVLLPWISSPDVRRGIDGKRIIESEAHGRVNTRVPGKIQPGNAVLSLRRRRESCQAQAT